VLETRWNIKNTPSGTFQLHLNLIKPLLLILLFLVLHGCSYDTLVNQSKTPKQFNYRLSSGLFSLPENAQSLDWSILNSSDDTQEVKVTVYVFANERKAALPGPIITVIEPNNTYHNANTYSYGPYYEVVLETNSLKVLPNVSVWSNNQNAVIPGTRIGPNDFVLLEE